MAVLCESIQPVGKRLLPSSLCLPPDGPVGGWEHVAEASRQLQALLGLHHVNWADADGPSMLRSSFVDGRATFVARAHGTPTLNASTRLEVFMANLGDRCQGCAGSWRVVAERSEGTHPDAPPRAAMGAEGKQARAQPLTKRLSNLPIVNPLEPPVRANRRASA